MALLELKGVGKDLGSDERHTEVLRDVNLAIEEGEAVAIVGYSGAGKTTLLSILAGLLHPDVGTATFRGVPIAGPSPALGVVFQSYSLLPWLTVVENVLLAVDAVHPDWSREEKRRCAERFIALVGLSAACDKRPAQLSGGMRQRVAVARALSTEPGVLLMDEPLGALDALTRGSLQSEIERIGRESGKTQVLITNDVDEALLMADRVVPLGAGPRATLGPSFEVPGARPRDARALARDPATKRLRLRIIEYLVESNRQRRPAVAPETERVARSPSPTQSPLESRA